MPSPKTALRTLMMITRRPISKTDLMPRAPSTARALFSSTDCLCAIHTAGRSARFNPRVGCSGRFRLAENHQIGVYFESSDWYSRLFLNLLNFSRSDAASFDVCI